LKDPVWAGADGSVLDGMTIGPWLKLTGVIPEFEEKADPDAV
jgi:hypothetical protein